MSCIRSSHDDVLCGSQFQFVVSAVGLLFLRVLSGTVIPFLHFCLFTVAAVASSNIINDLPPPHNLRGSGINHASAVSAITTKHASTEHYNLRGSQTSINHRLCAEQQERFSWTFGCALWLVRYEKTYVSPARLRVMWDAVLATSPPPRPATARRASSGVTGASAATVFPPPFVPGHVLESGVYKGGTVLLLLMAEMTRLSENSRRPIEHRDLPATPGGGGGEEPRQAGSRADRSATAVGLSGGDENDRLLRRQRIFNSTASRTFFLLDTFEGMPWPGEANDDPTSRCLFERENELEMRTLGRAWTQETRQAVQRNIEEVAPRSVYPREKIVLVKGNVEETLEREFTQTVSG